MVDAGTPCDNVAGNLFALIDYVHASANLDLFDGIIREDLSFSQLLLLETLREHETRPTLRETAQAIHVSEPAVSRIVDGLVRRDLIRREQSEVRTTASVGPTATA